MQTRELTFNQVQFAELLEKTPWLIGYWDLDGDRPECNFERLKADMGAWSHGEQIMARFMHAVWCGENQLDFDPRGCPILC